MKSVSAWIIAWVIILTGGISSTPKKISVVIDKKILESGELQIFQYSVRTKDDVFRKRVIGVILIDAPPDKVWRVLKNWDAMGSFLPSLEYYRTRHVVRPSGKNAAGMSLIEGKLKIAFVGIVYTLRVTFDHKNFYQEWKLVTDEEIKKYKACGVQLNENSPLLSNIEGFEYIEPYGDETRTVYYYAPVVEAAGVPVWAEKKISKNSLSEYMLGVKKRVMSLK